MKDEKLIWEEDREYECDLVKLHTHGLHIS